MGFVGSPRKMMVHGFSLINGDMMNGDDVFFNGWYGDSHWKIGRNKLEIGSLVVFSSELLRWQLTGIYGTCMGVVCDK